MGLYRKKILLSGASGLLGSQLIKTLSATHEIHAIIRSPHSCLLPSVRYYYIDFDTYWNSDQLPRDMDIVIHLSQSNEFRDFPEKALSVFNVNISSTARLLDYAFKTKVKKFLLASSGGVYGGGDDPFKETHPIKIGSNLNNYLGGKFCSELLAQNYVNYLDVQVFRFFFIYGKYQKRSMLIPRLVDNIMLGKPIQLQGEDGIKINPIHVSDAALAVAKSLDLTGSYIFNIAGEEIFSIKDIAKIISSKVGISPVFELIDNQSKNLVADIVLMKNLLHCPDVEFSLGIEDLLNG